MKKFTLYIHFSFEEAWPATPSKAHTAREMVELTFTEIETYGRPDIFGPGNNMVPTYLDDDVHARLKALARQYRVGMATLVRACTRRYMIREGLIEAPRVPLPVRGR